MLDGPNIQETDEKFFSFHSRVSLLKTYRDSKCIGLTCEYFLNELLAKTFTW